jgi:hypothetical protein
LLTTQRYTPSADGLARLTTCQCRKAPVKIFAPKPPSTHHDTAGLFQRRQVLMRITSNQKEIGPFSFRYCAEVFLLAS